MRLNFLWQISVGKTASSGQWIGSPIKLANDQVVVLLAEQKKWVAFSSISDYIEMLSIDARGRLLNPFCRFTIAEMGVVLRLTIWDVSQVFAKMGVVLRVTIWDVS